MTRFTDAPLRGARFRVPPGCRLVAAPGRTPSAASVTLFVPPEGGWQRRQLLSAAAASLLASLGAPQTIDREQLDATALIRLVLDGLIEFECGDGYRSGGDVHRLFFPGLRPAPGTDRIGRLSDQALHLAATLIGAPPVALADRLYRFNTRPWSPAWQRRLPDDHAVAAFHGLDRLGSTRTSGSGIEEFQSGPWQVWHAPSAARDTTAGPTWKLYLSPTPDHTADASHALFATLGRPTGPFSMKVGRTLAGTLRPDRIVAYFTTQRRLDQTATRLSRTLAGVPAVGVPFTASCEPDGLLSWGADFPVTTDLPELARERSWRGWLTIRLASALAVALASGADDPVTCALDRVSLDGVDTHRWTADPTQATARTAPGSPDADQ